MLADIRQHWNREDINALLNQRARMSRMAEVHADMLLTAINRHITDVSLVEAG